MAEQPNLIYVFADQLRFSSVGFNGDEYAHTPFLDSFSDACVNMENAVSGHPVCAPYRASLLTGKYTTGGTGMVINELRINPNHRTLAHVLTENGYGTSYIGKWHMYASRLGHHYDTKNSFIPKGENRLGFDEYFAAYNFHHEYYAPKAYYHLDTPEKIYCKGYEPDDQTDLAIERIRAHKADGRPFALFLSYGTPHDPWTRENVPEEYYDNLFEHILPNLPNYYEVVSYEKGYEFLAYAKAGRVKEMWKHIYLVWGDWMDQGHTRFPENFMPNASRARQLMFYNRPYGLSLCHGANGVPVVVGALQGILGFSQSDRKTNEYTFCPELMHLKHVKARIPVKEGMFDIELNVNGECSIKIPAGCVVRIIPGTDTEPLILNKTGIYTFRLMN